jgi:MFS family permease
MFQRPKTIYHAYPPQFWLLFSGLLISTIGTSMVWPFMTIFVSEQLDLPLASVASLITLNGFVALIASFIAGPITDRAGRKWIMVVSLVGNGASYFLFSQASTLPAFAILMALRGLFQPLYRVGTNAMVADLVPPEQRAEAFALVRMSFNVGIAIGPAVGGIHRRFLLYRGLYSRRHYLAVFWFAAGSFRPGNASKIKNQRAVGLFSIRWLRSGFQRYAA